GDPRGADLAEARTRFESGDVVSSATLYQRAAEDEPRSWRRQYDAGIALARADFNPEAVERFDAAIARLASYESAHGESPEHHAAVIATHYAAAEVVTSRDCVTAIRHRKQAVARLRRYVDAADLLVLDRRLPFTIDGTGLESWDVWNALAIGYLQCTDYPDGYFARFPEGKRFLQAEYDDPAAPEIVSSPFKAALTTCIETNGSTSRCWALSNLNRLALIAETLGPRDDGSLPAAARRHEQALARLSYNVARLAAEEPEDRRYASPALVRAHRFDRAGDQSMSEPIRLLGRHLAAEIEDYALLAEPWRDLDVTRMPLADAESEEVKGMAWALVDRWQQRLAAGRPEDVLSEIEAARLEVPSLYLESLTTYRDDVADHFRQALHDAIVDLRKRGNDTVAAGIRDLRPAWLGDRWSAKAASAWRDGGFWGRVWIAGAILVALAVILVLLARRVVYPYLLYTTDYYRTELDERYADRQELGRPFLGSEQAKWREMP
ncbi:MAG: hypothetical protein AAGE94_26410, partial [Acidobacteriota bacterium]